MGDFREHRVDIVASFAKTSVSDLRVSAAQGHSYYNGRPPVVTRADQYHGDLQFSVHITSLLATYILRVGMIVFPDLKLVE